MEQKRRFRKALQNLKVKDSAIAKRIMMEKCGWSSQTLGQKADGERALSDWNKIKVNEFDVVESTLKGFGRPAWEENYQQI